MADETNKRLSTACAVSSTLREILFFFISTSTFSGGSSWFKPKKKTNNKQTNKQTDKQNNKKRAA